MSGIPFIELEQLEISYWLQVGSVSIVVDLGFLTLFFKLFLIVGTNLDFGPGFPCKLLLWMPKYKMFRSLPITLNIPPDPNSQGQKYVYNRYH